MIGRRPSSANIAVELQLHRSCFTVLEGLNWTSRGLSADWTRTECGRRHQAVRRSCRFPPGSVPAALVAGRALGVPSGWAFGPPLPRPVQPGGRRMWEATRHMDEHCHQGP